MQMAYVNLIGASRGNLVLWTMFSDESTPNLGELQCEFPKKLTTQTVEWPD